MLAALPHDEVHGVSVKAETTFSLKDDLFNRDTVAQLSAALAAAHAPFDGRGFQREVLKAFPDLELKARIDCLVETSRRYLPDELSAARRIWQAALPPPLNPKLTDDDFGHFIWVVPGEFMARYGCNAEHLDASLEFLRESTQRFSAESAIRPFLAQFPDATLAFVQRCASDPNYHVRRLASEGIRPFLPWASRVVLPTAQIIDVLDTLHADPTRYVTRSVANNLNDLSRLDADAVIAALQRWEAQGRQNAGELAWMIRHALRTLLTADDPRALALLGYPLDPAFRLTGLQVSESVPVGGKLAWRGTLRSGKRQRLKIALNLGFLKANGQHSGKIFKVKDVQLDAGEQLAIDKAITLRPMTTRVLYPGEHWVELVVNGVTRGRRAFDLRL